MKLKKIITILMLSVFCFIFISGLCVQARTEYSDFVIDEYTDAGDNYDLMRGYEDGTFRPNNPITRAEFAAALVRTAEVAYKNIEEAEITFTDMDKSNWAYESISKAITLGFISGFEDGTFHPYDNVTYEQAVTMIFNLLGYKPVAELYGGYPHAYISLGYYNRMFDTHIERRKGSIEMNEEKQKKAITRKDALTLLGDTLYTPICVVTGYEIDMDGSKAPVYSIGGDGSARQTLHSIADVTYFESDE